jgi:TIR domain-containing protein
MTGPPTFAVKRNDAGEEQWNVTGHINYNPKLQKYLNEKWGQDRQHPGAAFLQSLEYLLLLGTTFLTPAQDIRQFILTPKAYSLLEKPASKQSVFVSYMHQEGTALALLIEARIMLVGDGQIHIDKTIELGKDWNKDLKEKAQSCTFFIAVIGPTTLTSKNVTDEIEWAVEAERTIIPVLFDEVDLKKFADISVYPLLTVPQGVIVNGRRALDYEVALTMLLNRMGYTAVRR